VRSALQRGEPILESRLAPVGTKGGLSSVISEGKRAVTVKVNEVIGVAGFALPGNLVDVMVNAKDANNRPVSKIVLEQILVLAVAQEANRDETKPKVVSAVTLELTPVQAEQLDLARSVGNLSLVLRNQLDKLPVQTAGARTNDLLHTQMKEPQPKAPVAAPAPRRPAKPVATADARPKLEVIRGTHKTTQEF
jgi:pilus assembly protein CpaB